MRKFFTVQEANALLPELSEQLRRMQQLLVEARERQRELQLIRAVGKGPDGRLIMAGDHQAAETALRAILAELEERLDAVRRHGCILRDVEAGLVDFPALWQGREVYLCWQLGEPKVAYYHDLWSGYAGRQPLACPEG